MIRPALKFDLDGKSIDTNVHRYEVLEPSTAKVLARFTNIPDHHPAHHDQQIRQRECPLPGD